jgi:hypothetical protein
MKEQMYQNETMKQRFFNPFVGKKYNTGIQGKKILVVGASFYCNKDGKDGRKKCPNFEECTSPDKKDSSKFDKTCPEFPDCGLRNEPSAALGENYPVYSIFAKFIRQFVDDREEDVWQRMAFTNYIQFQSPTKETMKEYLSQRDFDAFVETLRELQPDVVVSWGMVTIKEVRDNNPYIIDPEMWGKETEGYVCHMKVPGVSHEITLVCCYHPSSPHWYTDLDKFTKYFKDCLRY